MSLAKQKQNQRHKIWLQLLMLIVSLDLGSRMILQNSNLDLASLASDLETCLSQIKIQDNNRVKCNSTVAKVKTEVTVLVTKNSNKFKLNADIKVSDKKCKDCAPSTRVVIIDDLELPSGGSPTIASKDLDQIKTKVEEVQEDMNRKTDEKKEAEKMEAKRNRCEVDSEGDKILGQDRVECLIDRIESSDDGRAGRVKRTKLVTLLNSTMLSVMRNGDREEREEALASLNGLNPSLVSPALKKMRVSASLVHEVKSLDEQIATLAPGDVAYRNYLVQQRTSLQSVISNAYLNVGYGENEWRDLALYPTFSTEDNLALLGNGRQEGLSFYSDSYLQSANGVDAAISRIRGGNTLINGAGTGASLLPGVSTTRTGTVCNLSSRSRMSACNVGGPQVETRRRPEERRPGPFSGPESGAI